MKSFYKILFILIGVVVLSTNSFSQVSYYSQTLEQLNKAKTEAVKAGDYSKAAEIKKEIDSREQEVAKIESTQKLLDEKVKAEDFEGAAKLKVELQNLKNVHDRKEKLRTDIAQALVTEDFEKASSAKRELQNLVDGKDSGSNQQQITQEKSQITSTPEQNTYVAPPPSTTQSNNNKTQTTTENKNNVSSNKPSSDTKPAKTPTADITAYSMGRYAPFGLVSTLIKQKGVALYLSCRYSLNLLKSTYSGASIKNGMITDNFYSWTYANKKYYSRWDVNLGMTIRIFGDVEKVSGGFATAIGFGKNRYMYDYKKYYNSSYMSTHTLLDNDRTNMNLTLEEAFIFNFYWFNVHLGATLNVPNINETQIFCGLGFSF